MSFYDFYPCEPPCLPPRYCCMGPPGAIGVIYGAFTNPAPSQTFPGGTPTNGTIMSLTQQAANTVPGAFMLNSDGSVTVIKPGIYLVTASVAVQSAGVFAVQINGTGSAVPYYNTFQTLSAGTASITTSLPLNAGDRVSIGNTTVNSVITSPTVGAPSFAMTLLKIA